MIDCVSACLLTCDGCGCQRLERWAPGDVRALVTSLGWWCEQLSLSLNPRTHLEILCPTCSPLNLETGKEPKPTEKLR